MEEREIDNDEGWRKGEMNEDFEARQRADFETEEEDEQ